MAVDSIAAVAAAPGTVIPGSHSSVNDGPDGDRGVIVWRGPDFHIYVSARGGPTVRIEDTTNGAPSVAVLPDGRTVIAFVAGDASNALHVGQFNGTPNLQAGSIVRVGGVVQTAAAGPALAADPHTGVLYLAWAGTDRAHHLNFLDSMDGGQSWLGPVVTTDDTVAWAPTLTIRGTDLYVGWTGTDPHNRPNVARYVRSRQLDKAGIGGLRPLDGVLFDDEAPGGTRVATDGTRLMAAFSTNSDARWLQVCLDVEDYPAHRVIFSDPPAATSFAPPDIDLSTPSQPELLWTGTDGQVNRLNEPVLRPT